MKFKLSTINVSAIQLKIQQDVQQQESRWFFVEYDYIGGVWDENHIYERYGKTEAFEKGFWLWKKWLLRDKTSSNTKIFLN